jgi:hypothetical protein
MVWRNSILRAILQSQISGMTPLSKDLFMNTSPESITLNNQIYLLNIQ